MSDAPKRPKVSGEDPGLPETEAEVKRQNDALKAMRAEVDRWRGLRVDSDSEEADQGGSEKGEAP